MIRIVTDTDSNLPESVCNEYRITMVPILIIYGSESFKEYVEITVEDSYARMNTGLLPTTSQPSAGDFQKVYESILAEDPGATILSIHISGAMSGTCASAKLAMEMLPEADIRLFDTRTASLGQGLLVREAAEMARDGQDAETILARLAVMRENSGAFFLVKSLDHLMRGGRIGRASGLMGTMLEIKPVLTLTDGAVDQHSKFRTWNRALAGMVDLVVAEVQKEPPGRRHLSVMHILNDKDATYLADRLKKALAPDVFLLDAIGPGIGVHLGAGALGVCWSIVPE